ncbi:MAG: hypothetical protein IJE12_05780 [Prevotella sp.]|nr:hypothetical protein [Prevotella sp.]
MNIDSSKFEKFIIKQIVNTVEYNPERDEYIINRIHISDDIIRIVEKEGKRYGLSQEQSTQFLTQVANNIKTLPSVDLLYSSFSLDKLNEGQHIKLTFVHEVKGRRFIDMLTLGSYKFYVLNTDLSGLKHGDELKALDRIWHNSYYIDFEAYRDTKRIPNVKSILRLGKIEKVEIFSPSLVNEIHDSGFTYLYDEKESNPQKIKSASVKDVEQSISTDTAENIYYVNSPIQTLSQANQQEKKFTWRKKDGTGHNKLFLIKEVEGEQFATLEVNENYKNFLGSDGNVQYHKFILNIELMWCIRENKLGDISSLLQIKTERKGYLKLLRNKSDIKEWLLIEKPVIKFIYK